MIGLEFLSLILSANLALVLIYFLLFLPCFLASFLFCDLPPTVPSFFSFALAFSNINLLLIRVDDLETCFLLCVVFLLFFSLWLVQRSLCGTPFHSWPIEEERRSEFSIVPSLSSLLLSPH